MLREMRTLLRSIVALCAVVLLAPAVLAGDDEAKQSKVMRIGMIGLDTSHAPAFTKLINAEDAKGSLARMKVVAAYPGGSQDIASSRDRVEGFTQQLREIGVEIVGSVDELVGKVDAVLLESVDGRKHLEQVLPVFKAGLPVFIDKPLAGDLTEAIAIDMLAKLYDARWFSSSSLRFSPSIIRFREDNNLAGNVRGASSWGPCSIEPTHTDLYWYGVHAVETLYTAMGTGCESVTRIDNGDIVVVGSWADGRTGTVRGITGGKKDYGLVVFGEKQITVGGKYEGYQPLVERIGDFFVGGQSPVSPEETLEMFTFMQAADTSRDTGRPAKLSDVYDKHKEAAEERIKLLSGT
ncbi:MAG: Gfo/Idh/MocA family oxidoreductase [Aureliella sp.]